MSCPEREIEMSFKGLGTGEEKDLNFLPLIDKSKKAQEGCKCLAFVHGGCVGSKLMLPVEFHLEPKYLTTKSSVGINSRIDTVGREREFHRETPLTGKESRPSIPCDGGANTALCVG